MSSSEPERAFGVVLFHSVHGAMGAEKRLIAAGVEHKLIPVPTRLSSNCGFCVRFTWTDRDRVETVLSQSSLGVERIVAL